MSADRWVLVPRDMLERASHALNAFCRDERSGKSDRDARDDLNEALAAAPAAPEPHIDGWPLYSGLPPAAPAAKPVTLADVLDALNQFNRPKPSEDDGPWEGGHFIRVDHLPDFINIIAAAWFAPAAESPVPLTDELRKLRRVLSNIRAIFQAGRDSYETACQPMNTDEEAWEIFLRARGIGSKP